MRFVFVTGEYPPTEGGVGDYSAHLGRALLGLGHSVVVLTSVGGGSTAGDEDGIKVLREVAGWGRGEIDAVARRVASLEPDVVNFQYVPHLYGRGGVAPGAALLPAAIARHSAAVVLTTMHELFAPLPLNPRRLLASLLQRLQLRVLLRSSTVLVATNPGYARRLTRRAPGRRVHQIPVGSNIEPPTQPGDSAAVRAGIGATGSVIGDLSPAAVSKRPLDLVTVLAGADPSTRLLLVGGLRDQADSQRRVAEAARSAGVEDRVHATGYLAPAEVSRHLGAIDVCVHTAAAGASSRSGTLAAALGHGLPVVGYHGPETPEFLSSSAGLVLVPAGDTRALTSAVTGLLVSPERRREAAAAAGETYRLHLTWDGIARQVVEAAR